MDHGTSISYANDHELKITPTKSPRRFSPRVEIDSIPSLSRSAGRMEVRHNVLALPDVSKFFPAEQGEGVKKRIRGSRKISDIFSTAYESDVSHLAETAQGLKTLTGVKIVLGVTDYTHGPGIRSEQIDEPLILHTENPTTKEITTDYYAADVLGSITELVDKNGTVTGEMAYNGFGKIVYSSGSALEQPYSYTGREFDREINLYYYRARHYDAGLGRFMSEDSLEWSILDNHSYSYISNNPISQNDPLGRSPFALAVIGNVFFFANIVAQVIAYYDITRAIVTGDVNTEQFALDIGLVALTAAGLGLAKYAAKYIKPVLTTLAADKTLKVKRILETKEWLYNYKFKPGGIGGTAAEKDILKQEINALRDSIGMPSF